MHPSSFFVSVSESLPAKACISSEEEDRVEDGEVAELMALRPRRAVDPAQPQDSQEQEHDGQVGHPVPHQDARADLDALEGRPLPCCCALLVRSAGGQHGEARDHQDVEDRAAHDAEGGGSSLLLAARGHHVGHADVGDVIQTQPNAEINNIRVRGSLEKYEVKLLKNCRR